MSQVDYSATFASDGILRMKQRYLLQSLRLPLIPNCRRQTLALTIPEALTPRQMHASRFPHPSSREADIKNSLLEFSMPSHT